MSGENSTESRSVWDLCEDPPENMESIASLYHWSTNYETAQGPFSLFLDIIGWSDEQLEQNVYSGSYPIGYVEASKLAEALTTYADRPHEVHDFVEALMDAEMAE